MEVLQSKHTYIVFSHQNNLKNIGFWPLIVFNTRTTRKDTAPSTHKNTCIRRDSYPRPRNYLAKRDTTELQGIDGSTSVKAHLHRSFHIETISKAKFFWPFTVFNTRTTRKDTAHSTHKNTCRRRDLYPRPHDYLAKRNTTELQRIDGSTSVKAHLHRSFHIETISKTKFFCRLRSLIGAQHGNTLRPQLTKILAVDGIVPTTSWLPGKARYHWATGDWWTYYSQSTPTSFISHRNDLKSKVFLAVYRL